MRAESVRHDEFVWGSLETLCDGFGFTEGPLWHPSGTLLFQDLRAAETLAWSRGTGVVRARVGTGGANGQTFDQDGHVVFCEGSSTVHGGQRRVGRVERDATVSTLADRWEGRRLNAPNDIVSTRDGSLYFTNPKHIIPDEELDIPYSAVYRIEPDGTTAEAGAVMPLPNGLAFSPDESILYVADTRPDPRILAYDVDERGDLGNERLLVGLPVAPEGPNLGPMLPDGIKIDVAGRLYVSAPGGVWVVDASGIVLTILRTPEWVTNLAFGGDDGTTLFMTCRDRVSSVRTTTPGVQPHGASSATPLWPFPDDGEAA